MRKRILGGRAILAAGAYLNIVELDMEDYSEI